MKENIITNLCDVHSSSQVQAAIVYILLSLAEFMVDLSTVRINADD